VSGWKVVQKNCTNAEAVAALTAPLHYLNGRTSLATYDGICNPKTVKSLAAAIRKMPALTFLDVSGYATSCEPFRATALAYGLQSLAYLSTLRMTNNCIGSEGATYVAPAFLSLTGLTDLNLEGNDLLGFKRDSRLGLEVLEESIAMMSNLSSLGIRNNTACRDERRLENFSDISRAITAMPEALRQKTNL